MDIQKWCCRNGVILLVVSSFFLLTLISVASGLSPLVSNCWTYTSEADGCTAANGCKFQNDSWGSWCEELSCWSLYTQSDCSTSSVPGKNCTWQSGRTDYFCEEINCWSFAGTDETSCVNNSANRSCTWDSSCYNSGGLSYASCTGYSTENSCLNASGCAWGKCWTKGCYDFSDSETCEGGKDWRGNNCTWSSSKSYCKERNCWDYELYPNETTCAAANGINCEWKWNSCQEVNCWSYDFTNETACVNNTANKDCIWTGNYCSEDRCWAYDTNATCSGKNGCTWKGWTSSGYCQELDCWKWDSWDGGTEGDCLGNSSLYGLNCIWQNFTGDSGGWCYKDYTTTTCSNVSTERDCMDTYYCWWEYNDWKNLTAGGTCKEPEWGTGNHSTKGVLNDWDPGCYIFDTNSTYCGYVLGCNYTNLNCEETTTGDYNLTGFNITADGIKCPYINDSNLCNSIPGLSSCCSWQNSSCTENRYSTTCFENLEQTPNGEEACEDAKAKSDCNTIAGSPWFMPCTWDNSTSTAKCLFKSDAVFGNTSKSIVKIENKRNCQAAGGKWITENYCSGNVSVPTGRCEYKFDEEDNCDKACFACQNKDSNGNTVNSSTARDACLGSSLGFCEFVADTSASNGVGICKAKKIKKDGVAGNCDVKCGDCTHKGDPLSNDTTKRPSYYCSVTKANSAGGGCKWINDNSTNTGGYCLKKGDKICEDSCDRCYDRTDCVNEGRTSIANKTGSCKWEGDENDGTCVANVGNDVEVCWDGVDNDNDGLVDCADSACYADSYCGIVEGDCFGWQDNNSCADNGCEWAQDKWGSWCDFKGSQCWKYDVNETFCGTYENCIWNNESFQVGGNCEQDWKLQENCHGLNSTTCTGSCSWTNDTWCDGYGAETEWCLNDGGWCDSTDFTSKDCWTYSAKTNCQNVSGCDWRDDEYEHSNCEVNWTGNCWNNYNNATCVNNGCSWFNDTWGGWCSSPMAECWNSYTETTCEAVSGNKCTWESSGNYEYCEPACYDLDGSSNCEAVSGCMWQEDSGWCEEKQSEGCFSSNITSNQTSCEQTTGCRWRQPGWCSPKDGFSPGSVGGGGGVGGTHGADCYKYDGNQSLCTNKTAINISCGWFANTNARCEVDWSKDCWEYDSEVNGCNSTNGCWWHNDDYGQYCTNLVDQCWSNDTLTLNATLCNSNSYCNSTTYGCEPGCFQETTANGCGGVTNCKWMDGWCNPSAVNDIYDNMESGQTGVLGVENCTEGIQSSVDICEYGMKDMGDAYGFGLKVAEFTNASMCNKEKLSSSFVAGSIDLIGQGTDNVTLFVYLDTDGGTTGGCTLKHNSSAAGYEFRFKYSSLWDVNRSKSIESSNAYKCENSKWVVTDIKLSAWKKIMCSDIGGPIVAMDKEDLARYPTLYNSTADMRVVYATIGNSGNVSTPTDTTSPAWVTPGGVDFSISDAFAYGADTAQYEDILKNGYVDYEDCFNSEDDDNDGATDCFDWDCLYQSVCASAGVNAAGFVDTKTPKVTGVMIEEYPDSSLIVYDTDKPSNGSLLFYFNDSTCTTLNATVNDIGVTSSHVREYKSWHKAQIYDSTIGFNLLNDTAYYYRVKVCDDVGKCAVSQCSKFVTSPLNRCGFCDFVTRIKAPDGWNVSYDADQDGVYEHLQGSVCGPKAGMKTNYTDGRSVNVKLGKSDDSVYFEFINVTLTKTGLNDKVRTISSAGDIISSSSIVGLPVSTRDKLINNLHPEICRVKIPFSGTCASLYHCDDDGANCVDRTSEANLTNSTTCVWQIPYCEFSTYREAEAVADTTTSSSSSSGSGGGGGGGSGGVSVVSGALTPTEGSREYTVQSGAKIGVNLTTGKQVVVVVDNILKNQLTVKVGGKVLGLFGVGDNKELDLNSDGSNDVIFSVGSISLDGFTYSAIVKIKFLQKAEDSVAEDVADPDVKQIASEESSSEEDESVDVKEEGVKATDYLKWLLLVAIGLVAAFAVYEYFTISNKKGKD
jgi:hypothetical protein